MNVEEIEQLRLAGEWGLLRRLGGMRVALTGKMSVERADMTRLIEAAGGRVTASVTGSVDLLVMAQADSASVKAAAARRYGVRIMTEAEFAAELLPTARELESGERAPFGALR